MGDERRTACLRLRLRQRDRVGSRLLEQPDAVFEIQTYFSVELVGNVDETG